MKLERRDWWWMLGMTFVGGSLGNKGGWFSLVSLLTGILIGASLGLLISRLTRKSDAGSTK
jgi:hypothetical protein